MRMRRNEKSGIACFLNFVSLSRFRAGRKGDEGNGIRHGKGK